MYIQPNSTIKILHNIPLEPSYEHTIYFATRASQEAYFTQSSKVKYSLTAQTYTRVNKGKIRVEINAENLYDCNYLMFQNTSFSNKWFYAFIDKVEYVNNLVSEITFTIDVMQTWLVTISGASTSLDYTVKSSFIEREHTASDSFSGVPELYTEEEIATGEDAIGFGTTEEIDFNDMSVCILVNRNVVDEPRTDGLKINNTYVPMRIITSTFTTQSGAGTSPVTIDALLDSFLDEEIVAVYQYPTVLGTAMGSSPTTGPYYATKSIAKNHTNIAGSYQPKNNKLFTYPYNYLLMSNNAGQTAVFKWELFENSNYATFGICGVFVSIPEIICYPTGYRGIGLDYDSGVVLSNFPQCAWSGDTWKAWWAQHKSSILAGLDANAWAQSSSSMFAALGSGGQIGGMVGGPAGAAAGALIGAGMGAYTQLARMHAATLNAQGMKDQMMHTPSQTRGQSQTSCLNTGMQRYQYNFYRISVRPERAQIIDDYFVRYGYASRRNKVPNIIVNRLNWCYTKTVGCSISGNMPADDIEKICSIFDSGITFWKGSALNSSKVDDGVGDYTWPT